MEQQESQKEKSLAWFKLADLIARGEREKALNVFRLLSHSLQDRAYSLQLEGDLLWYLDDKNFTEKYKQAAFLYQKEKRWIDAIALNEHLLTNTPTSFEIMSSLLIFYAMVDWQDKLQERHLEFVKLLSDGYIDQQQYEKTMTDLLELAITERTSKRWLGQWLIANADSFQANMASRIKELLAVPA